MTAERALTFSCAGETLVGICSGVRSDAKLGVLVIVGGPQYRVGCHRQFVLLARAIARFGIPAMRFDYRGMGDSDGETQSFEQTGADIAAAIEAFMRASPSLERVVLWGLCDGASASLLYWHATNDARVAGMALLNPWISSDENFAKAQIRQSFHRVLQRSFWKDLFGGGIDLPGAVRKFASAVAAAAGKAEAGRVKPFQERMAAGLETFKGPVLIVLSGRDLAAMEFAEQSRSDRRWRDIVARPNVEQHEIAKADHTFSDSACRVDAEALVTAWLARSFPGSALR